MKKLLSMILAAALLLSVGILQPVQAAEPEDFGRTLVVYFSATGNTEDAANAIAEQIGADVFELQPADPYTSVDLNYNDENSRVVYEYEHPEARDVALVADTVDNWDEYDTVFIGYPIWWGIAAWPVNGFVQNNDFTGKTVIPFCTSASSGIGESGTQLAALAGTGDWLDGQRFSSNVSADSVASWLDSLEIAAPTPGPTPDPEPSTDVTDIFSDVKPGTWYEDAVQYAYEHGLMTGVANDTFAPELTTSRAMIVSILHRLVGSPAAGDANFSDVSVDDWYAKPVAWAASEGIVSGYGDGTFGANDAITREQLASILYRYAEYQGLDVSARADLSTYSDANSVSPWATDVVRWANAEGLLNGVTSDTLAPQGLTTRAQAAAMLERFIENGV